MKIYSFTTVEEIKFFHSRYGNNIVPYSIAVSKNYTYLQEKNKVLKGKYKNTDIFDLYDKTPKSKKVKNYKLIHKRNS